MIHPVLAIASVLALLLILMIGLGVAQKRNLVHPELARKGLHVSMGSVAITFPWVFNETWPVWVLGVLATGTLMVTRYLPSIRSRLGGAIHCVNRRSFGDLCFPFAIALLFQLADGDLMLYVLPMLILTLGDSMAALVGVFHGRTYYRCPDGKKTIEGSMALFTITFLSVYAMLGLYAGIDMVETLLIAINMAVLVTLVEAVSWRGLDNLLIPISSYYLAKYFVRVDAQFLLIYFSALTGLMLSLLDLNRLRRIGSYLSRGRLYLVALLLVGTATDLGGI